MGNQINNPFLGRSDGATFLGTKIDVKYYATAVEIQRVEKTGEGEQDFTVITELKIDKKVKHQDYLDQFADDVGILNVLKRVVKTGDTSLFNERPVATGFMDLTNMPDNIIDAQKMIEKANASYEKLPEDIKAKLSKDDLIKANNLELANQINLYVENLAKLNTKKEGEE